jgi:CRP/FNR family cyclic AMP-dependent transcriptional regulator
LLGQAITMDRSKAREQRWPAGSLLGGLSEGTCAAMLAMGRPVRFADGELLLREGDSGSHLYLLLLGYFKIVTCTAEGNETLIAIRTGGDLVGELAIFDGGPRIATVRAAGRGVAQRIEKAEFMRFLAGHDDALQAVMRTMAGKLRSATRRRSEFASCPVAVRVARVLTEMMRAHGRTGELGVTIGVSFTQPDLATLVGASVPTVQRVLRDLREDGIIETRYRQILVRDAARLFDRARLW